MTDKDIQAIVDIEDVDNMIEFGLSWEQKEKAIEYAIKENKLKILFALVQDFEPSESKHANFLILACQKQNDDQALRVLCKQKKWYLNAIQLAYEYAWQIKNTGIVNTLYFLTGQWFDRATLKEKKTC